MNITMLILGMGLIRPLSAAILKAEDTGTVTRQEPLFYQYNLKGPMVLESEIIPAAGTIQAISAFWDFEGRVTLEASATAGSSYIPIVNGQVLEEGFLPGNQLRLRINIGEDSLLKAVVLGYKDSSGVNRFFYNQELPGFKYHKVLRVEGGDKELFNYPVKIELKRVLPTGSSLPGVPPEAGDEAISTPEVKEDFSDIRFTAPDSQIPLNYYLEGGHFWLKIPQIPKEGIDIHLYYGNPEAKDASNPQTVFLFYDDFSAKNIDQTKWTVSCGFDQKPELNKGELKLDGCSLSSSVFAMKEGILEFKARSEAQSAIQAVVHGEKSSGAIYRAQEEMVYSSSYPGAEHTIAVNDVAKLNAGIPIQPGEEYIYKAIVANNGIIFERYNRDYQKEAEIRFLDTAHQNKGYIGLKADTSVFRQGNAYFDWIRTRPYAEVEPKVFCPDDP